MLEMKMLQTENVVKKNHNWKILGIIAMILTVFIAAGTTVGLYPYMEEKAAEFNSRNRRQETEAAGGIRKSDHPGDEFQLRSLASAKTGRKWWYPYLFPDISHRRWGRGCGCLDDDRCAECAGNTEDTDRYSSRCRCHRKYRCSDRWGCRPIHPFQNSSTDESLSRDSRPSITEQKKFMVHMLQKQKKTFRLSEKK